MSTPSARAPQQLSRAVAATLLAALVGVTGHVLVGGTASPVAVAAGVVGWLGPAWLLAGRERGWTVIASAQLVAQQLVHALLTAAGDGTDMVGLVPHDIMLYAHVAAAALAALWLRGCEQRAWKLARDAARILADWLREVCARWAGPTRSPAAASRPAPRCQRDATVVLRHALIRRGPPQTA